jgi:hypothetical protein
MGPAHGRLRDVTDPDTGTRWAMRANRPGTGAIPDCSATSGYRLVRRCGRGGYAEVWKSSRRLWPGHIAQMGVYFLLIEERYGVRPPYGYVVLGSGKRHRIENDPKLMAWVLNLATQIRAARTRLHDSIKVNPKPGLCRWCGQRANCGQARA